MHQRACAACQMRKSLTGVWPRLIDPTQVALQKYAAARSALQYSALFGVFFHIVGPKLLDLHADPLGQPLGVALGDLHARHATTVGASGAVDLLLDLLRDPFQAPLL